MSLEEKVQVAKDEEEHEQHQSSEYPTQDASNPKQQQEPQQLQEQTEGENHDQLQEAPPKDPPAQLLQDDHFDLDYGAPIFIQVSDPIEKGSGMSKYTVYTLKGKDALGEFEIQRRFNEFFTLREVLLAKWPGQYIPPIPDKQMNIDKEAIIERVRLLNIFVMKMTQIRHLYYSEEFATVFLRSLNPDIAKQLSSMPKPNVQSQIAKYKKTFDVQEIIEPPPETIGKMNSVQSFMRRSQTVLIKLYEQSKQLSASRKALKEQFLLVFGAQYLEYERNVLMECIGNAPQHALFTNPQAQEMTQFITFLKDQPTSALDKIQDLITTEQRDLEAFLQAFATRDNVINLKQKAEAKLQQEQSDLTAVMTGKTNFSTLKGSLTKMSVEEQKQKLELQMMETQKEVDCYKEFYRLVTLVLTMKQIDKFKRDKHESYRQIIKELARLEQDYLQHAIEYWTKMQSLIEQAQIQDKK